MKYFNLSLLIVCSVLSLHVHAFKVDSLLKVMNGQDNSVVLTSDRESGREYIHVSLSGIVMSGDDKGKEFPLDANNVSAWPVLVEPGEVVLDAGDEVKLKIIRNSERQSEDMVIGISFIPDAERVQIDNSSLQVSVGYKTWLILPGTSELIGDIRARRDGKKIIIDNISNKIIRVLPESCASNLPSECLSNIISLPGTSKIIDTESSGKNTLVFYSFADLSKKLKEVVL